MTHHLNVLLLVPFFGLGSTVSKAIGVDEAHNLNIYIYIYIYIFVCVRQVGMSFLLPRAPRLRSKLRSFFLQNKHQAMYLRQQEPREPRATLGSVVRFLLICPSREAHSLVPSSIRILLVF